MHPLSGDEAVEMLASALCRADPERHTGIEASLPCQHHSYMAIKVLEALSSESTP